MKKIALTGVLLSVFVIAGCGSDTPDKVAKSYVKDNVNFSKSLDADCKGLEFVVVEENDEKAVVEVKGAVQYEGELKLLKNEGKWVVQ